MHPRLAACLAATWAAPLVAAPMRSPHLAPPQLVYAQGHERGGACDIMLWDSSTRRSSRLNTSQICPQHMSADRSGTELFLLTDDKLWVLDLRTMKVGAVFELPRPAVPDKQVVDAQMVGRLDDGSLAVKEYHQDGYSDDFFLFARLGNGWKLLEQKTCDPADPCPFQHRLDGHSLDDVSGDGPSLLWGKGIEQDPFFLKRGPHAPINPPYVPSAVTGEDPESVEAEQDEAQEEADTGHAIVFDFGVSQSTLIYDTVVGPDFGDTLQMATRLEIPGRGTVDAGKAVVMGRYLYTGSSVLDLSDGAILLDHVGWPAGWLY